MVALLIVGAACSTAPAESDIALSDAGAIDRSDGTANDSLAEAGEVLIDGNSVVDAGTDAGIDAGTDDDKDGSIAIVNTDTVWGVIGTGQSLGVGAHAEPVITNSTRYANLKLGFDYPDDAHWHSNGTLVYLGEPIRRLSSYPYPYNIMGESPHTSMADEITALSLARTGVGDVTLHTVVGKDGLPYESIKKNGIGKPPTPTDPVGIGYSFQAALDEVTEVKALLAAKGLKYRVGAIVLTHGETDYGDKNYASYEHELWADYNDSLQAITGDTATIPMIVSQISAGYPVGSHPRIDVPTSAVQQWLASMASPTEIFISGPKYQYEYFTDNVHFTAAAERRLGVKYGQVYDSIRNGVSWKPLQPNKIAITGNVITVDFDVPVSPIQFDESLDVGHTSVHLPWKNARGFEVFDDPTEIEITSVVISGPAQVQITVAGTPSSAAQLRFALANDGPGNHRKGQVCDSDPLVGIDAETVNATVINGSTVVTLSGPIKHGARDLAVASGLAANTIIQSVSGNTLTLSKPWTGASGTASIVLRSDQRNYLVQFSAPLNFP